ncbi:MAG: acetylxylan esterase [Verrucomicrobiota bacterium]
MPTLNPGLIRSLPGLVLLAPLAIGPLAPPTARAADTNGNLPPPVPLSAVDDHQRLMGLLHMTTFRKGKQTNYEESRANPCPDLPDPLTLKDGTKVTTARMWWEQRRPEIVEDFDREIYGRMPRVTPGVKWEVASVTNRVVTNASASFPVIEKRLLGHVDNSAYTNISVTIQLSLTLPANAAGPSPVIMVLFPFAPGFGGGFPPGSFVRTNTPAGTNAPGRRGGFGGFGLGLQAWQATALSNGWGYATLGTYSIQADGGAGLTTGIIGLCNQGQPRKPDDWGVLRAWAWGASRALDYFETDPAVNARQVGLEGHSRWGKAAVVAMAYDQRFAIAYVSSSGEGGAKINRRNYGEVIENAAWWEAYHWYAGNFIKYAGPLTAKDLPVDGHELIALCAPRPVFIGAGAAIGGQAGDGFADPRGMFMATVGAGPVYKLLGRKNLGTDVFPPPETALIDGDVAYREHSGGHTDVPNWPAFLEFAGHYIKVPGLKPVAPASGSAK